MRAAPVVSLLVTLVSLVSLVSLVAAVATLVPSWGRAPVELLDSLRGLACGNLSLSLLGRAQTYEPVGCEGKLHHFQAVLQSGAASYSCSLQQVPFLHQEVEVAPSIGEHRMQQVHAQATWSHSRS